MREQRYRGEAMKRMQIRQKWLWIVTLTAACGGVSENRSPDAGSPDAAADATPVDPCVGDVADSDLGDCYLQSLCSLAVNCLASLPDEETCPEFIANMHKPFFLQIQRIKAAISAGKVSVDTATARACFDDIEACNLGSTSCQRMLNGTTGAGMACVDSLECGIGGRCVAASCPMQCCSGTCENPKPLNGVCTSPNDCENGHRCVGPTGAPRTCLAGVAGDLCLSDSDCNTDHACDEASSKCKPRSEVGEACASTDDCRISLECISSVCRAVDSAGVPCNSNCIGPFVCGSAGTCIPLPTIGQSCPDNRCLGINTSCRGGVCVALGEEGDSCASIGCRIEFFCEASSKICEVRKEAGQGCANNSECLDRRCAASGLCEEFDVCY